jgi:hypothetical protein
MVLVAGTRLWCSLVVQSAGPRIEVLRFGLLLVLTVALASVAVRIHSHPSSSASHRPGQPITRPSPVPSATHPVPVQVLPTASTRPPRSGSHPHVVAPPASNGAGGSSPQTLPVTGWDATVKLGALAFALIAGGSVTVRVAGPRRQRVETVQD